MQATKRIKGSKTYQTGQISLLVVWQVDSQRGRSLHHRTTTNVLVVKYLRDQAKWLTRVKQRLLQVEIRHTVRAILIKMKVMTELWCSVNLMDLTTLTCKTRCSISSTSTNTNQTLVISKLRSSTLLDSTIQLPTKHMVLAVLILETKAVACSMKLRLVLVRM